MNIVCPACGISLNINITRDINTCYACENIAYYLVSYSVGILNDKLEHKMCLEHLRNVADKYELYSVVKI